MRTVLTIAGNDPSGGAGLQADIKTMGACGVYGMGIVTALTAQNTTGVYGIHEVPEEFLAKQLDCVFQDIFPDAVKIGMVSSSGLIQVIADKLRKYKARRIVLDPILVSTSGTTLLQPEAEKDLREKLFPLADVLTPNVPECGRLTGQNICSREDMEKAARMLGEQYGCAVVCKGGHLGEKAEDVLYREGVYTWISGERISNENTHGTGCTYSSALASSLAMGYTIEESARRAKEFMEGALKAGLNLGKGNGPLDHFWNGGSRNE